MDFYQTLVRAKYFAVLDARLASQPCGFSPLCFEFRNKKIHHSVDFYQTLVRAKYFAVLDARLASQPCGFSPLCFKVAKKSTIRWIFIKLWCEQSTSPCWTHGSPRNPAGSRPFALNSATKKSTIRWIFIKPWCEQAKGLEPSTSTLARLRSSQLSYARTVSHILTYLLSQCK